jgi:hypothetical protein
MKKKIYQRPATQNIEIQPISILCASGTAINLNTSGVNDVWGN